MDETYQIVNTLLYQSDEGAVSIDVVIDRDGETMWTTQKTMAELFNVSKSTISEHLKHIFEEGELNKNSTVRKIRTVQNEGSRGAPASGYEISASFFIILALTSV